MRQRIILVLGWVEVIAWTCTAVLVAWAVLL